MPLGNSQREVVAVKGEVVETVPESKIVETLIAHAERIAEEEGLEEIEGARAEVKVTK